MEKHLTFLAFLVKECQHPCSMFFRCGKQRLREARIQGVDYLILGLAGICLGTLAKVSDETFGALGYTYTVIAVCKFYLDPDMEYGIYDVYALYLHSY